MLAGPSNAGLADPGNGTLISLHQVTVALLIHGGSSGPQAQDLLTLKAISKVNIHVPTVSLAAVL